MGNGASAASWLGSAKGANTQSYRYVFLQRPDDDRAVAAFELVAESDEAAKGVAQELLDKSEACIVEVWSQGQRILHMAKSPIVTR